VHVLPSFLPFAGLNDVLVLITANTGEDILASAREVYCETEMGIIVTVVYYANIQCKYPNHSNVQN